MSTVQVLLRQYLVQARERKCDTLFDHWKVSVVA